MPEINAAGLTLIESFEGLSLTSYPDPGTGGEPFTIGYGHTGPDVHPGETITHTQATALLESDVAQAEHEVATLVEVVLTPNEFAALVSFQFNNENQGISAWENHLCLYVHGGNGQVMEGLVRRRAAEFALWKTP
jgi:lysozyme